jgi:PAS domain S-box-containing protein
MAEEHISTYPWFIKRRSLTVIIVSLFLLLSVAAFFLSYEHYETTTEQSLKEDRAKANLVSLVLAEHLQRILKTLESYAHRPLLIDAAKTRSAQKARQHLINLTQRNPDIESVVIVDKDGTFWASQPERPESMGMNFAYRDWYKGVSKEWKPYISDVFMRRSGEKDVGVQVCVPFFDERGRVIGILVNTQRTAGLRALIERVPLDPGSSVSITDRKGNLVYSTRYAFEREITPYPFHSAVAQDRPGGERSIAVEDTFPGGGRRYVSLAPVAGADWTVFVGRSRHAILRAESAHYIQIAAICLLMFLMIALSLIYSRKHVMLQQAADQLQAEEAIRESEERFRLVSRATNDAIWDWNLVTDELRWGGGFTRLFGYREEETEPTIQSWYEHIHPDERDRVITGIHAAVESGEATWSDEYRFLCADGSLAHILDKGYVIHDLGGKPVRIVGAMADITDRKRAEEEVRSGKAFLDLVIDMSPFAMWISDERGTIIRVNRSLCDAIDLPEDVIVGKYNVLEDANLEIQGVMPAVRDVFEKHKVARFSIPWKAGDAGNVDFRGGRSMYIDVSMFPIRNAQGELTNAVCQWVDLTDRRRAEEEVRETRDYLENLLNYANAPIIVWDPDYRVTRFNHAFETLTGIKAEEILGRKLDILFPDESREDSLALIRRASKGERWKVVEIPILRRDGTVRTVLWNSATLYSQDGGTPVATIAQGQDITERKQAEEEARESEERYRVAIENSSDGVKIIQNGVYVYVNRKTGEMCGYDSLDEIIGQPIGMLIHPDDRKMVIERNDKRQRGEPVPSQYEVRSLRRDGTSFESEASATLIFYRREPATLVYTRDISARKGAERALRESEAKYRSIFENAIEGIFQSTPEGQFLSVNPAFARMFGYDSPEEMTGAVTDVGRQLYVRPEDRESLRALLTEGAEVKGFEAQFYRKDRTVFWVSLNISAVRSPGKGVLYWEGTCEDITESKRAQEEIRTLNKELEGRVIARTAELAAANKELEAFSYSVSHDLRAPLRAIDGFSQALLEDYYGKLDDEAAEHLTRIRRAAQHMGQLIDDLLRLSHIARAGLRRERIDMTTLATGVAAEIAGLDPERRVKISIAPDVCAEGDPDLLRIVLQNLLDNAFKFSRRNPVAEITFGSFTDRGGLVYFVRDNGVGFDPAYLDRLFRPFERLHRMKDFEGTGIGLATVQRIIHKHGGKIWTEAKEGKGATFYFTLQKASDEVSAD